MKKVLQRNIGKLSLATLFAAGSMSANSFEIENDGWTFSVHGNINTNYIHASCDSGGATVLGAFMCAGSQDPSAISNGYLPTSFEFALATQRNGYDISVHTALDRGLDTNEAFNAAGDGEGFRTWMTVSNDDIGSVLLGRNWGLFAYDSTFLDMSVFSTGGGFLVNNPVNTQLGAAGTGYIFLDRITQATWTLPTSDTWVAQIGIFQPLNLSSFSFNSGALFGAETGSESPGLQGRLRFNFSNGFISSSFFSQDVDATVGAVSADYRAVAYDVTGQVNFGDLALTATYHEGDGVGHTGFLIDAVDPAGQERDTDGYYVQAMYTAGSTRYGLNYGVTNVDTSAADAGTTMEEKSKITAGVYHSLASGITLTAEYSQMNAENKAGGEIDNDIVSLGAIFFF
jgi:hypothetical protein